MEIAIPTDNDGFVLLECPYCGGDFKITPSDMEDEEVLHIHCPYCGKIGDSYLPNEVIEVAMTMAANLAFEQIHNSLKTLERKNKRGPLRFNAGKAVEKEYESPILVVTDTLIEEHYNCCNRDAKVKPSMKIAGTYCPFCGVKYFEY